MERRFDAEQSTALPRLTGIAEVDRVSALPKRSLLAVYFDTATRDLTANQLSLCRTDDGWQLRLPAGGGTEVRVASPTPAAEVPAELRDVALAVVRDRPLAPVAQVSIERHVQLLYDRGGVVLAEFHDEQLTASSTPGASGSGEQCWRQWKLLADGPELLDELSDRLCDAGARPAGPLPARLLGTAPAGAVTYADELDRAVAEQVGELLVWDRAVRADADDAVHQMRVTLRRIRSLLQTSAAGLGLGDHGGLLDELRWLAGLLGTARDAEVLAQRYRHALDRLPSELVRGRVRERLVDGAERRYRAGLRRSLAAMRTPRYFRLLDGLDAVVTRPAAEVPPGSNTTDQPAVPAVDGAYRRVQKAAKNAARIAGDPGYDDALHRIRKSAKRLRYTAAATRAGRVAERAKAIQTLLGDHQDSVVSREHLLHETAAARDAGEDTFTYGLLYQQEDDLARSCRSRLDHALDQLAEAVGRADELACKPDSVPQRHL